jgi:addiction module HigA family antidote
MTNPPNTMHPGQVLLDEVMTPLGVSRNKLARDIDVPVGRISAIVAGTRAITADTALRLAKYFGTTPELWMRLQAQYDIAVARETIWKDIAPRVRELKARAAPAPSATAAPGTPAAMVPRDPELGRAEVPAPTVTLPEAAETVKPPERTEAESAAQVFAAVADLDARPEAHPPVAAAPLEDSSFAAPALAAANDETPTLYDLDALAEDGDGPLGPEAHDDPAADDDDILMLDNALPHALAAATAEIDEDDILDLDRIVDPAGTRHRTGTDELLDPESVAIPEPPARRG